jgi:hypothetical protein
MRKSRTLLQIQSRHGDLPDRGALVDSSEEQKVPLNIRGDGCIFWHGIRRITIGNQASILNQYQSLCSPV